MSTALAKFQTFNRNFDWQQQQQENGFRDKVLFKTFEFATELKVLEQVELEAEVTKDHALKKLAETDGFRNISYADLELLRKRRMYWYSENIERQLAAGHVCRRADTITCSGCHVEDRISSDVGRFLAERERLHRSNPDQYHHCTASTVSSVPGCRMFSLRFGERVSVLSRPGDNIVASATWFICLNTGKMHRCKGREQCSAVSIEKQEGVTLSYSCVISGYKKNAPVTKFNSWDGVHFYSQGRLDQIHTSLANQELDEVGGQEYGDDGGGEFEAEYADEEAVEVAVIVENSSKTNKKLSEEEELRQAQRKRGFNALKEQQPDDDDNDKKSSKKQRPEDPEDASSSASLNSPDHSEQEPAELPSEPVPAAPQRQPTLRESFVELLTDRKKSDVERPLDFLRQQHGGHSHLALLAQELAEQEIEEMAEQEKRKAMLAQQRSANRQIRFGFASNNRNMRNLWTRLKSGMANRKEKATTREGEEVLRRRASQRTYTQLTSEEKTTQFLARGTESVARSIIAYVLGPDVKNRVAQLRLPNAVEVANLAVSELQREYDASLMAEIGVWCDKFNEVLGCTLFNVTQPIDMDRYSRIILSHWADVSTLPMVTEVVEAHKKKKRKPLDFVLYCLGVLYLMARGGVTVRVRLTGSVPDALLNCESERLRRLVHTGPKVVELPDERSAMTPILLDPALIKSIPEVYIEAYPFTGDSLQEALTVVKQCYEARHRQKQRQLYDAIADWELAQQRGEDTKGRSIESIYMNYCRTLRPPHSV